MIQEMDTLAAQDKLKILQLKQQELAQQLGTTDFI
jgi:transcriptional regulator